MNNSIKSTFSTPQSCRGPGLVGITIAVILLELANIELKSIVGPILNPLIHDWTSDLSAQWALFFDYHILGWWRLVSLVVFGTAAFFVFRCTLRDVFILPQESQWSFKKSAIVSVLISIFISAIILGSKWSHIDPTWHWGVMAGNIFSNMYEELFYRAFLFGMLLKFSRSPWWAIVVTAVFFTVEHGQYSSWESFGFLIITLPFGWLTWKSGWIFWPFVVHMLADWFVDPFLQPGYISSYL